jgi:seryl-tRNA synthetase
MDFEELTEKLETYEKNTQAKLNTFMNKLQEELNTINEEYDDVVANADNLLREINQLVTNTENFSKEGEYHIPCQNELEKNIKDLTITSHFLRHNKLDETNLKTICDVINDLAVERAYLQIYPYFVMLDDYYGRLTQLRIALEKKYAMELKLQVITEFLDRRV